MFQVFGPERPNCLPLRQFSRRPRYAARFVLCDERISEHRMRIEYRPRIKAGLETLRTCAPACRLREIRCRVTPIVACRETNEAAALEAVLVGEFPRRSVPSTDGLPRWSAGRQGIS